MGKDVAHRLLKDGYTVFVAARSVDKMEDLVKAGAIPIGMDISKEDDVVVAMKVITGKTGGVDVLINNAGFAQYGPVEETDVGAARYRFEVNLFGLARLTQLVLPFMRGQKKGPIINISSVGGVIYTPLGAWIPAGQSDVEAVSSRLGMSRRTLQRRLRGKEITFQDELARVRERLARDHLSRTTYTSAEITLLLGYADPNSFIRGFQGWTGTTPEAVRGVM